MLSKPQTPILRDYQRKGVEHLLKHANACLFQCPGLGKTLQVLLTFVLIKRRKPKFKMLIVAPLKVAQTVWRQEAKKWDPTVNLRIRLIHGKNKRAALYLDSDIHVINYEGLIWLEQELRGQVWPWDIIVYDELTKCKSISTRRAGWIKRNYSRFKAHWGLTGTPMSTKGYQDLFGQIRTIDDGNALGQAYSTYEFKYFYFASAYDRNPTLKKGAAEIITKRISPIVYQLTAEDHLNMPEKILVHHDLTMTESHQDIYDKLESNMMLEFSSGDLEITAVSAGVLWSKLLQVLQGFSYTDDKQVIWHNEDKIDRLEEIIEESNGEQVLVFYHFRAEAERLVFRFPDATLLTRNNTEQCVEDWNAGKIRVLLASPLSASHGLNLQLGGAHIMVWLCQNGSPEIYQQAVGRLYRQGQQKEAVIIHHINLVTTDDSTTVDDDIIGMLKNRTTVQTAMLRRLASLQAQRLSVDAKSRAS